MKFQLAVFIFFICSVMVEAQPTDAYELRFKVRGVQDTTAYLANYYGARLFYKDTTKVNANGEMVFTGKEALPTGKYAVVIPGPKFFEVFIQEQRFEMETDTTDLVKNIKVKDSPNNKLFYDYIHFIIEKRQESQTLNAQLAAQSGDTAKSSAITGRMVELNNEVLARQNEIVANHPDLIAAKAIKLMIPVTVPEPPVKDDGSIDSLFAYRYYLNHFLDHADLSDPAMVRLPEFHQKLDEYFNRIVVQVPDSINHRADQLIEKIRGNDELFQYVVQYVTNNFETSQIMGMDAVFLHLAEKYYLTGQATWADSSTVAKIGERVERIKPTMIGNQAPPLILADSTLENWIDMKDIEAKYTILYFYDPDCGHCKKKTPDLIQHFQEVKNDDVVIIAVSGSSDDDWKNFIREKGLGQAGIYNLAAPQKVYEDSQYATQLILDKKTDYKSLNYRNAYDVFSTPKVFLLDENKKIVAKQVGVDQVFDILKDLQARKRKE